MLFLSMLLLGAIIGFVGAGGAGVTIALLVVGFGVPIHTALAVALAAMVFTMISGTISHFREHEIIGKTGAIIGVSGIFGAFLGANVSNIMPSGDLSFATAFMLLSSAVILYVKIYHPKWLAANIGTFPFARHSLRVVSSTSTESPSESHPAFSPVPSALGQLPIFSLR